jgi:thiamine pyrophosphate-dependent acetolactate synthase large subunit-like protein
MSGSYRFGAFARRVEQLTDLETTLQAAREHGGPAVVEVMTDPNDVGPRA